MLFNYISILNKNSLYKPQVFFSGQLHNFFASYKYQKWIQSIYQQGDIFK